MAFLNLFKDWVFLIEPRRSFHNLGAAAWKDQLLSVVSVLPLQGARSKPSLERKSYLWKKGGEIKRITNEILGVKGLKILFDIDILSISPFYSFRHKSAV